MLATDQN